MKRLILCLPFAVLAACQQLPESRSAPRRAAAVIVEEAEDWSKAASPRDAAAIEGLQARWAAALAEARRTFGRKLGSEGEVLNPGATLPRAAPPPGAYRCRAVRIGGKPAYVPSRAGFCYVGVTEDQLSFTSELPGRRLGGYLWDLKDRSRLVFLGSAIPRRAKVAPAYGSGAPGDTCGLFERIGDMRYRLVLPDPATPAALTIIDMTAAPQD